MGPREQVGAAILAALVLVNSVATLFLIRNVLLSGEGKAVPKSGERQQGPDEATFFYNVTVFFPIGGTAYRKQVFKKTTRNQLVAKLQKAGSYFLTMIVNEKPETLIRAIDVMETAQDIEEVDLYDGVMLAVLVDLEPVTLDTVNKSLKQVQSQEKTLTQWQQGQVKTDEVKSVGWAVKLLQMAGHTGVRPFCYSMIKGKVKGHSQEIEIDALAFSDNAVILVECKPRVSMENVEYLEDKMMALTQLVEAHAPNTEGLLDPKTGTIKPLQALLSAGSWVDDPYEQGACMDLMEKVGIEPTSEWSAYRPGDNCHVWPPTGDYKAKAKIYYERRNKRRGDQGRVAGSGSTGPVGAACNSNRQGSMFVTRRGACMWQGQVALGRHHVRRMSKF